MKTVKKYSCCGLQDYSLQISLRSASGWWRTSSLHFVYVIFLAPPVLKTLKISYGLGFYTLKDFLWWTMPLISILNCRILSTSILFLGVKCCQIIKTDRQFSSGTPPHTWWFNVSYSEAVFLNSRISTMYSTILHCEINQIELIEIQYF